MTHTYHTYTDSTGIAWRTRAGVYIRDYRPQIDPLPILAAISLAIIILAAVTCPAIRIYNAPVNAGIVMDNTGGYEWRGPANPGWFVCSNAPNWLQTLLPELVVDC